MENHLGIKSGHTTPDMMFTIQEVECLGACANAPMVQVNGQWFYEDLTPENTVELLDNLRDGKEAPVGPQNHRINSEGPMGRTTLVKETFNPEDESNLITRDFAAAKAEWEAKKAAAVKK